MRTRCRTRAPRRTCLPVNRLCRFAFRTIARQACDGDVGLRLSWRPPTPGPTARLSDDQRSALEFASIVYVDECFEALESAKPGELLTDTAIDLFLPERYGQELCRTEINRIELLFDDSLLSFCSVSPTVSAVGPSSCSGAIASAWPSLPSARVAHTRRSRR